MIVPHLSTNEALRRFLAFDPEVAVCISIGSVARSLLSSSRRFSSRSMYSRSSQSHGPSQLARAALGGSPCGIPARRLSRAWRSSSAWTS